MSPSSGTVAAVAVAVAGEVEEQYLVRRGVAEEPLDRLLHRLGPEWQEAPFEELSALPEGGKPVTERPSIDDALNDVAAAVKAAVASIRAGRRASAA